ncbi:TPA: Crp/Fnr family transcriptional regulator [Elizabethkingia anophelis]|nr:Crp/Fnr family transcriptional regulator [Elizabethkingia anophelis]MCT3687393.1 Crp/Fnr family transcriptional regulator [Elizabethkingia anophelis]MCT3705433.1 Crp/Fnr family transcriptional regulator [Elizabethkingia anophelis]MCT3712451.1 Crp/Fnr family transcriptional regulator [Elizabethkingia anophelis]MCT3715159.1 Crp/Fnr family transcriptional regulator [Elizabethkingia anophelis]
MYNTHNKYLKKNALIKLSKLFNQVYAAFLFIFTLIMDMLTTFRNISFFQELSDEEINFLVNISTPKLLHKKEKLIAPGQAFNYFFIISNGLLRFFFDDENGVENNLFLPSEKEAAIIENPEAYSYESTTKYTIEAVVDTQLFLFNKNAFEEAAFKYRGIHNLYIKSLKQIISILKTRTEQLCSSSPHSRYEDFLRDRPFTSQNASRKHIANFLGITPNSLSRMTARIHQKRNQRKK